VWLLFASTRRWGYFFGRPSGRSYRSPSLAGDGHTAGTVKQLKVSEDETFRFALTWLNTGRQKGWTINYRPKHPPLSQEVAGIFQFLGVNSFQECPQFDFEECQWRSVPFEQGPYRVHAAKSCANDTNLPVLWHKRSSLLACPYEQTAVVCFG